MREEREKEGTPKNPAEIKQCDMCVCVLYLTLCNPMDCSTPGSSIHRAGDNMELLQLSLIPTSCPMNTQSNFLEKGLLCKFSFKISPSSPPLPAHLEILGLSLRQGKERKMPNQG